MYGLILTITGKTYLELGEENGQHALYAAETIKEIEDRFSSFKDKLRGYGYESHVSSAMGLINLRPQVIKYPNDPNEMRKYLANDTVTQVRGTVLGARLNFAAVLTNENIKELIVLDLTHKYICGV